MLRFHPAALEKFMESALYCEEARPRLGQLFREAVRIGLDRIMAQPEIGAVWRGTRRLVVDGFRYDIVYRSVDADLEVPALAHHRRRPWYWRRRV